MTRYQLLSLLLDGLVFMMGAGIGSFLNVVIYRVPLGISVNNPKRSFCPSCKTQIPWYRNLPLLSWLQLRGRCAHCGVRISVRYFLVELLTGIIFFSIFRFYGGPWESLPQWGPMVAAYWVFASLLVAGTFIDIDHFILPLGITVGGLAAGLIGSTLLPQLMGETLHTRGLLMSFLSACAGGGLLWTVVELGKLAFGRIKRQFTTPEAWSISQSSEEEPPVLKVADLAMTWDDIFVRPSDKIVIQADALTVNEREFTACQLEVRMDQLRVTLPDGKVETVQLETVKKLQGRATKVVIPREAMGFGDVYLLAMIGSFLGWKAVLFTIVASSCLGSIIGVGPRLIGKTQWTAKIPFGPYLAAGAMIWLYYGPLIVKWYLDLLFQSEV